MQNAFIERDLQCHPLKPRSETLNMVNKINSEDDWATGNASGRGCASKIIHEIVSTENPALLGWALRDMIAKGKFGAIEVGFANRIAEALIIGADNAG